MLILNFVCSLCSFYVQWPPSNFELLCDSASWFLKKESVWIFFSTMSWKWNAQVIASEFIYFS